jgi:hypothetical protein
VLCFVAGYGVVFAVLCAVAVYTEAAAAQRGLFETSGGRWMLLAALLLALPVGTAWLTLELAGRVRPRRWFDHRVRRPLPLALLGFGSGVIAAAECTLLLAWGEELVPAWLIIAVCTVLAVGAAFMCIPAVRRGHCIHCGYDLTDGGLDGRCTECGSLDPL